ncbi:DUF5667 domain-containing protein (plasmid) [Rossellomorea sp. AcN35-11]|nr:DUF5667 domain-containing protein [Rossellomorea aquimaris]WJV32125.1 DUF5667 domain-containing protein [Rossellomorea sp. AcN35-11]
MDKGQFHKGVRNVVATTVMATAFSLGGGGVFANENEGVESEEKEVKVEARAQVEMSLEDIEESDGSVGSDKKAKEDAPSLLPGDMLYFLKTLKENVQLAFTFDEEKDAELLASFTEERIQEAEALYDEGNKEEARKTLERAVEQQEEALEKFDTVIKTSDEKSFSEDRVPKLEEKLETNLASLQVALDNVENKKAKEALTKNITRIKEHREKQVKKHESKKEWRIEKKQEKLDTENKKIKDSPKIKSEDNFSKKQEVESGEVEVAEKLVGAKRKMDIPDERRTKKENKTKEEDKEKKSKKEERGKGKEKREEKTEHTRSSGD